jgi:SAM-dependent methyltransferase
VFHVKHNHAPTDICDYEGSDYRERFWTAERRYEDLAERQALRALLPARGHALADLGAGFGRLADLYSGYERIFLVDYSRTMLRQARERWGSDPRFTFIATDIRRLPLADSSCDAVVMIRVLHHLREIDGVFQEVARVLAAGGSFLLEFANKRHLKAIGRWALRRQPWNPFSLEPIEFAELNFDFHPVYVERHLARQGLTIEKRRALSLFRWAPLKARFSPAQLCRAEAALAPLASLYPLSPSVLLRARVEKPAGAALGQLVCPRCRRTLTLERLGAKCEACRLLWPSIDGVLDFKGGPRPF